MLQTMAPGRATELTGKQVFMLFPTPMFTAVLPELSICDRAEKVIRDLQKAAKGRSSPPGATLAYMTPDDIKTLPEMKELLDIILRESALVLDAFAVKRDSHYITNMWGNIGSPNTRGNIHVHPNCLLSGLIYIKTPVNCGPTMFASPRKFLKNLEPTCRKKTISTQILSSCWSRRAAC